MGYEVFGPYESTDEVVKMVTTLELKGYKSSNISLFAHEEHAEDLVKNTDVNVESEAASENSQPRFIEKVQSLFSNDTDSHMSLHERLTNGNVSDRQAEKFIEAIENGKVVIIANNELKLGNDSTQDTVSMREDIIQRD